MSILWAARGVLEVIAAAQPSAAAVVGADLDVGHDLGSYRAGAGVGGELRLTGGDGEVLGGTVTLRGGLYRETIADGDIAVAPMRVEHTRRIAALPTLSAPRDLRRTPYDHVATTLWFDFVHGRDGDVTGGPVPLELTVSRELQHDGDQVFERHRVGIGVSLYRWCWTPSDRPQRGCLDVFRITGTTEGGALDVVATTLAPVAIDHVVTGDWELDASLAVGIGSVERAMVAANYDPTAEGCEAQGSCVVKHAALYGLRGRRPASWGALDLGAARTMYPTMSGELAIEDRAEASAAWPIGATTLTAHGFAAYTQWWLEDDGGLVRAGAEVTGGGDLTASRPLRGWQLDLSAAAARSYHAGHDGGAPRAELAAQGTVSLRRDWRGER